MPEKTALITGASSGIGRELARVFAATGANLVLVARQLEKLEHLAEELRTAHGIRVTILAQDLTAADGVNRIQDQIEEKGIRIDVLVNNAGFGLVGKFTELPGPHQMEMIQLNAVVVTDLARRFLPKMIERGQGAVLNVASTAAFQPGPQMAVYFATKAYVLSLSEALAEEVRGTGVRVCCLCPGPTATGFGERSGVDETLLFRLGTMDAEAVARQGYRALQRGTPVKIPSLVSTLVTFAIRFTPRWIVRRMAGRLLSK